MNREKPATRLLLFCYFMVYISAVKPNMSGGFSRLVIRWKQLFISFEDINMERYTFSATTAKSDVYVGLLFPALILLPILAIQLILFFLNLVDIVRSHPVLFGLVIFAFVNSSFHIANKMQSKFVKEYTVELDGSEVTILCDDKEILSGAVVSYKFKDVESKLFAKAASLDIFTGDEKIQLRTRAREAQSLLSPNWNPFATGSITDVDALASLGRRLIDTFVAE